MSIATPSTVETARKTPMGPIVRDVAIVWVLTSIGGFVVGFATALATGGPPKDMQRYMLAIAASNLLLGTVAFTVVGCLAPQARWRHLGLVAVAAWLTSLINVGLFGVSIRQWFLGATSMAIIAGIGGAISYVFKGKKSSASQPN
jgi:hypothetical protein